MSEALYELSHMRQGGSSDDNIIHVYEQINGPSITMKEEK